MSAYKFIDPGLGFPTVSGSATVQQTKLGLVAEAMDPTYGYGEFLYVQGGSASTPAAGDWCRIDGAFNVWQAVSGNTASHGAIGVAPVALSASNVFGWVQIEGVCDYANLGTQTTGAVGGNIYVGTTAGRAQVTASTSGGPILGMVIEGAFVSQYSTTANSNSGIVQLYWPVHNGR